MVEESGATWLGNPRHDRWLEQEGTRLLDFYERSAPDEAGGFSWLDETGKPDPGQLKYLWVNARFVHVFALAHLAGRPHASQMVEHGLRHLSDGLRDGTFGGWFWSVDRCGPVDASKQAYGHAFVLLAASTATVAGLPGGSELLGEVSAVVDSHFWDENSGCCVDAWDREWKQAEPYRGQNANMHLTEAFLAAAEATGEPRYLRRAERIADRLIHHAAAENNWRLPEHFDAAWRPDVEYNRDDPENLFRPYGSIIGHWFEWARLLVQLDHSLGGRPWMLAAAKTLFAKGVAEGWDSERGGLRFTVDWHGNCLNADRYHWTVAEAIGGAAALGRATGERVYEIWYQRFWSYAAAFLIDRDEGSWHHQLDGMNRVSTTAWKGKPDVYHAFQATLCTAVPVGVGFAIGLRDDLVRPRRSS